MCKESLKTSPGISGYFLFAASLLFFGSLILFSTAASGEIYSYDSTLPGQLWYFGDLDGPYAVAVDASGNVYVADTISHRILKYNSGGALLGTLGEAGVAGTDNGHFYNPYGLAVDGSGNLFVADTYNHRIQVFDQTLTHVGTLGTTGIQGTGNDHLDSPSGVALDGSGNIYVADTYNHRIQKFSSGRIYQASLGSGLGAGNDQFNTPSGVALDSSGNIYVADTGNNRIQKFNSSLLYQNTIDGADTGGDFSSPYGVAADGTGNVYVADTYNHRIQKFDSSGAYQYTLGVTGEPGTDNGHLSMPNGVAVAGGNVYVADTSNFRIQRFDSSGVYSSTWGSFGSDNGHLDAPEGVAVDPAGNVYIADTNNHRVQKFNAAGAWQQTLGVTGEPGTANDHLNSPSGVAADGSGNVYVADTGNDRIQKFNSSGTYQLTTQNAALNFPRGVAVDLAGNIYVADTDNHVCRKFNSNGLSLPVPLIGEVGVPGSGINYLNTPSGIAVDSSWNIYVADTNNHRVQIFDSGGTLTDTIDISDTGGDFSFPGGVAVDQSGNIYVADTYNDRIQKCGWSTDAVPVFRCLTILGETGIWGTDNGHFNTPKGLALDTSGNIYVADTGNYRVQKFLRLGVTPVTVGQGSISCLAVGGDSSHVICTMTPAAGYYVSDVRVGDTGGTLVSQGGETSHEFTGITVDQTIEATFESYPVMRVSGLSSFYHLTPTAAYGAAAASGDVIKIQAVNIDGINFDMDKSVRVEGGYTVDDPAFNSRTGFTTVTGSIEVLTGSVVADRLIIQ